MIILDSLRAPPLEMLTAKDLLLISSGMTIMIMLVMLARSWQPYGSHFRRYAAYMAAINASILAMFYFDHGSLGDNACCDGTIQVATIAVTTQVLAYFFYFRFVSAFLSLPLRHPGLHRVFRLTGAACIAFTLLYVIVVNALQNGWLANRMFDTFRLLLTGVSVYGMIEARKLNDPLARYFMIGNALYLVFAFIAWTPFLLIPGYTPATPLAALLANLQPAVIAESICFMLGLNVLGIRMEREKQALQQELIHTLQAANLQQKEISTRLEEKIREQAEILVEIQKEKFSLEKDQAIASERTRISRDMHDDLGSGLSAIHLLSNYLKEHADMKYPEFSKDIEKIRHSSEDLNQRIREIIWAVNAKDDTLAALASFIQRFARDMSDQTRIPISVNADADLPARMIHGLKRKHLYLCIKEAVNNALKHSEATKVSIEIADHAEEGVVISIHDNGRGFNPAAAAAEQHSHGLTNLKERMSDIGGQADIQTNAQGTTIRLTLPL